MTTFLLWLLYLALHSLLAADSIKNRIAVRLPGWYRYYRLAYNLVALSGIGLLAAHFLQQPVAYLFEISTLSRLAGVLIGCAGAVVAVAAFRNYGTLEFAGLDQLPGQQAHARPPELHTGGMNAVVRHPLYTGTLLLLAGAWLYFPTVAATGIVAAVLVYLPFGIYFEEKKLRRQFGEAYAQYQRRVKCLIPGLV